MIRSPSVVGIRSPLAGGSAAVIRATPRLMDNTASNHPATQVRARLLHGSRARNNLLWNMAERFPRNESAFKQKNERNARPHAALSPGRGGNAVRPFT